MRLLSRHRIHDERRVSKPFFAPKRETIEEERGTGHIACLGTASITPSDSPSDTPANTNSRGSQQRRRRLQWFRNVAKTLVEEETCSTTSEDAAVVVQIAPKTILEAERKAKQTRFDTVQVRTYEQILGDNPFVSIPLGMGWKYNEDEPTLVEEYDEANHEQSDTYQCAKDLEPLSLDGRRARLKGVGYTETKIQQKECQRKVQIAMEWAYRYDHPDKDIPCTIVNAERVIKKYVV